MSHKMKRFKLSESGARGWFIGDFPEAVHRTQDFEVNFQTNPPGKHGAHVHRIVTEIQLVTRGTMIMNGEVFNVGDIVVLAPGETGAAEFSEDCDTITVKFPSLPTDKYLV